MIDHISINVSDFVASKDFYLKALAPIGYGLLMEFPKGVAPVNVAGFGELVSKKPDFWIGEGPVESTNHIAFRAESRAAVDAFYAAAIAAGGKDNGGPGVRAHYHPSYYGAFVFDPDGHNVEACCHHPE